MRIERKTWESNQFRSAEQARAYARAREIEGNFHQLGRDIATLDNSPQDFNSRPGEITLVDVRLPKGAPKPPYDRTIVDDIKETRFTGSVSLDANNNPTTLSMDDGGAILAPSILAYHHNGLLGWGQDRLVIEQTECQQHQTEIATFFADGSIEFSTTSR